MATGTGAVSLGLTLSGTGKRGITGSGSVAIALRPLGAGTGRLIATGDDLVLGGTVLISDSLLGLVNEPVRVVEIERDLLVPGRTRVTLANRKRRLTDLILKGGSKGKKGGLVPPGAGGTPSPPPTVTPPTGPGGTGLPTLTLTATLAVDVPTVTSGVGATVTSVKIAVSTSAFPTLTDIRATVAITSPYSATYTALTSGQTLYVAGVAYDALGQESAVASTTIRYTITYAGTGSAAIRLTLSGVAPTPPSILGSDLWQWLKRNDVYSDLGTTLATVNGTAIEQWSDSSGNARHATQTTSGNRPTLVTGTTFNSAMGIRVDGSIGQWFSVPSLSALTDAEIFISLKCVNNPPSGFSTEGFWTNYGTDNFQSVYTQFPGGGGNDIRINFGTARQSTGVGNALPLASNHVLNINTYKSVGDPWTVRINNVSVFTNATLAAGSFPVGAATLGSSGGGINADLWYFECVIASRHCTTSERDAMYAYLSS